MLKTKNKGQKLDYGKGLSGKDRLTDAQLDLLQNYYSLGIRRNQEVTENMKEDTCALYFHTITTDDNRQHGLCIKDPFMV